MSGETYATQAEITKAADEIIAMVKSKADASEVDEKVSDFTEKHKLFTAETEGTITKLKERVEELEKAGALTRAVEEDDNLYEWSEQEDGKTGTDINYTRSRRIHTLRQRFGITKAINAQVDVPGSPVQSEGLYHAIGAGSPATPYVTTQPISGSTFKVPVVSGFSFSAEATAPANPGVRTAQGALSSRDEQVATYTGEMVVSEPAADDLPGLRETATSLIMDVAGTHHGASLVAHVKATVGTAATNYRRVATGEGTGLPANAAALQAKTKEMRDAIRPQYRAMGARWVLSPELFSALAAIAGENSHWLRFTPDGVLMLWGYPTMEDGNLETGGAAGDLSGYFGNLSRGIMLGDREVLEIREYEATRPGQLTIFARMRFLYTEWDPAAIVGLLSRAS